MQFTFIKKILQTLGALCFLNLIFIYLHKINKKDTHLKKNLDDCIFRVFYIMAYICNQAYIVNFVVKKKIAQAERLRKENVVDL